MMADPLTYVLVAIAATCVGLGKGGLSGIGLLSIPLLSQVMSPLRAAGLMLPILIAGDIIAVYNYRKSVSFEILKLMVPAASVGVLIGYVTATWVDDNVVRLMIGLLCIVFTLDNWVNKRASKPPQQRNVAKGFFWGIISGIVSFFANVGGPPYQVYVAPLRLPRIVFTGTTVVYFFTINIVKLYPFFLLGQINRANLELTLFAVPFTWVAVLCAIWIVRRLTDQNFYRMVYISVFLIGVKTTYDAVVALLAA